MLLFFAFLKKGCYNKLIFIESVLYFSVYCDVEHIFRKLVVHVYVCFGTISNQILPSIYKNFKVLLLSCVSSLYILDIISSSFIILWFFCQTLFKNLNEYIKGRMNKYSIPSTCWWWLLWNDDFSFRFESGWRKMSKVWKICQMISNNIKMIKLHKEKQFSLIFKSYSWLCT